MNINEDAIKFPNTKGIQRHKMPQIEFKDVLAFVKWIGKEGVESEELSLPVGELKPTQDKYNFQKVNKMADEMTLNKLTKRILVSKDGYIIDGHHRYMAVRNKYPSAEMNVIKFDTDVDNLLKLANEYPKSFTKGINESGRFVYLMSEQLNETNNQ